MTWHCLTILPLLDRCNGRCFVPFMAIILYNVPYCQNGTVYTFLVILYSREYGLQSLVPSFIPARHVVCGHVVCGPVVCGHVVVCLWSLWSVWLVWSVVQYYATHTLSTIVIGEVTSIMLYQYVHSANQNFVSLCNFWQSVNKYSTTIMIKRC